MDIATLIGLLGCLGVIFAAIFLGGSVSTFINIPSLVVVVGGTVAATLCQVSLAQFLGSFKVALRAFLHSHTAPVDLIEEAVEITEIARRDGVLALEDREINDAFLARGVRLCIDGHAPEVVNRMLTSEINRDLERQRHGITMFKAIGEAAPAMGMIGTLIGLVQMLANMDDPKQIGPAMAIALLTTLYGAVIANAIALPIAAKLKSISDDEKLLKLMALESIAAIQQSTNPRVLQQALSAYLPENQRDSSLQEAAA